MPKEIYLLKVGMTMTEGTIDEWYVLDGQKVQKGSDLYRLETEKVNMDVEAEQSGTVRHIEPAGAILEPGDVIGWIFEEDEQIPDELPRGKPNRTISIATSDSKEDSSLSPKTQKFIDTTTAGSNEKRNRIASSPAARRLADQLGIDIASVVGTGPRGRITREDVEAVAKQEQESTSGLSLSGIRKTIGRRMMESLQSQAQLTITMRVAMDNCIQMRSRLNQEWEPENLRLAYTDLVLVATARALQSHPMLNSSLIDDRIHLHENIDIGVAVAIDDGLIVPVVRNVNQKTLKSVTKETSHLVQRARNNRLTVEEVQNGTFTVSSLGNHGVDVFTPIINPPQTAILGVGTMFDSVRWEGNSPLKTTVMSLSLTWDHRVLDGTPAAKFLGDIRALLENPEELASD